MYNISRITYDGQKVKVERFEVVIFDGMEMYKCEEGLKVLPQLLVFKASLGTGKASLKDTCFVSKDLFFNIISSMTVWCYDTDDEILKESVVNEFGTAKDLLKQIVSDNM
jgi:hypothetical protein